MSEAAGESSRAASLSAAQTAPGGLGRPGADLSSGDGEGAAPTTKLYRYSPGIEYCDTLLVKYMVEIDRSNMGHAAHPAPGGVGPAAESVDELSEAASDSSRAASLSAAHTAPAPGGVGPGAEFEFEFELVTKSYRRVSDTQEFLDTLLVTSFLAVLESGRARLDSNWPTVLVREYHQRLRDEMSNPRPPNWSATEYLRHSAFKSDAEWIAYFESSKKLYGPDPGMPPLIHEWAQRQYIRWQFLKRDIFNHTHAEWKRQFPGGQVPTGKKRWEMIECFRDVLFKNWMMAPTSKNGHCNYKAQPMPDNFIPFSTWHLWVRMGPGAGACMNEGFINQCCYRRDDYA